MKILVIEDNDVVRNNILKYIEIQGDQWFGHTEYEGATYKAMTENYDIIILDLGLWSKEHDGLDICRELREKWNSVPILMLTARTLTEQKITWLDAWADDYLTKPFDYKELYSRINALVRRNFSLKGTTLKIQDIEVDREKMQVFQNGQEKDLSKLEFQLLVYMIQNTGRVITKQELQEKVWGEYNDFKESRSVDIYIGYLRKKLWKDLIETVRWVGYMIQ